MAGRGAEETKGDKKVKSKSKYKKNKISLNNR